jgi:hypothetical protein
VKTQLVIGGGSGSAPRIDSTILKAMARARRWFDNLVSGRAASMVEIGKREGVGKRYVSRLVRLAFLAPPIVKRIAEGSQPPELTAQFLSAGPAWEWTFGDFEVVQKFVDMVNSAVGTDRRSPNHFPERRNDRTGSTKPSSCPCACQLRGRSPRPCSALLRSTPRARKALKRANLTDFVAGASGSICGQLMPARPGRLFDATGRRCFDLCLQSWPHWEMIGCGPTPLCGISRRAAILLAFAVGRRRPVRAQFRAQPSWKALQVSPGNSDMHTTAFIPGGLHVVQQSRAGP